MYSLGYWMNAIGSGVAATPAPNAGWPPCDRTLTPRIDDLQAECREGSGIEGRDVDKDRSTHGVHTFPSIAPVLCTEYATSSLSPRGDKIKSELTPGGDPG